MSIFLFFATNNQCILVIFVFHSHVKVETLWVGRLYNYLMRSCDGYLFAIIACALNKKDDMGRRWRLLC